MSSMALAQGYVRIDTVIRPYIQFDYQAWVDSGNPMYTGYSILSMYIPDSSGTERNHTIYGNLLQYNYIEGGSRHRGTDHLGTDRMRATLSRTRIRRPSPRRIPVPLRCLSTPSNKRGYSPSTCSTLRSMEPGSVAIHVLTDMFAPTPCTILM